MKKLVLALPLLLSSVLFSQEKINTEILLEDYNIIKTIIRELSPRFNETDKNEFDSIFNEQSKKLVDKSLTLFEFMKFLSKSEADTKSDEHGMYSLPEEAVMSLIKDKKVLFPLPVNIIGNRLIVNGKNLSIPFGSIISSINGVNTSDILSVMLPENDAASKRSIEIQFDIHYFIEFGKVDTFEIAYQSPENETIQKTALSPLTVEERVKLFNDSMVFPLQRNTLNNVTNTQYFEDGSTYYLQLNTFNGEYDNFNNHFKTIFEEVANKKAKNLVIDLRYNTGGNLLVPGLLFSYIAQKPFAETLSTKVPDFNIPYKKYIQSIAEQSFKDTISIDNYIKSIKKDFTKKDDYYEFFFTKNKEITPQENVFKGPVYLLIGGRTISAASYFTALFKSEARGKIIGEEIGGSHHNITAGQLIKYKLPGTGILLDVPIMEIGFSSQIEKNVPEQKIMPDITISDEKRFQYFLNKQDAGLLEIYYMIKK